jgi:hypothetical protein
MCMNCGCGLPNESHGKKENLTAEALRRAGSVNRQSLRTTAEHILQSVELLEGRAGATTPRPGGPGPANQRATAAAGSAARSQRRRDRLAAPAGRRGASRAPRGTPASES